MPKPKLITFPFKPEHLLNKHGGKIVEITGIEHRTERPAGGFSRDYWFFTGSVLWEDTGRVNKGHIDPGFICWNGGSAAGLTTPSPGQQEWNQISDKMMEYLNKNGVWSSEPPHDGWYANRRGAKKK